MNQKKCKKDYLDRIDGIRSVLFLNTINRKTCTLITSGEINAFLNKQVLPYFKNVFVHEVCTEKIDGNNSKCQIDDSDHLIERSMKVIVINHKGGKENDKRLDKILMSWDIEFNTSPSSRTDIPAKIVGHNLKL